MSISSKHIHETISLVNNCRMPISWSRFASLHNTEFGLHIHISNHAMIKRHVMLPLLSLLHHVVVLVKALICILYNKGVHHWYRCRRCQTLLLFKLISLNCLLLFGRLDWRHWLLELLLLLLRRRLHKTQIGICMVLLQIRRCSSPIGRLGPISLLSLVRYSQTSIVHILRFLESVFKRW